MRLSTVILAGLVLAGPVGAAPASPMEQCTAQWLDLKAAGKTGGQAYRPFLTGCLKSGATVPVAAEAPPKAKVNKSSAAKLKRPNRMQQCAAKWRDMKASSVMNGMTYREFSSQCLSGN